MNEDTAARVARTVAAFRNGVYVSRQTMQELLADIHDSHDSEPQREGNTDTQRVDFLVETVKTCKVGLMFDSTVRVVRPSWVHTYESHKTLRENIDAAMKDKP